MASTTTAATTNLKATVLELLRDTADAHLRDSRPDFVVGFTVTRQSRDLLGWQRRYDAAIAEREPQAVAQYAADCDAYEAQVRHEMAVRLQELRRSAPALLAALVRSHLVPTDLRLWALRQVQRAERTTDRRNPWIVPYVYLVLQSVLEHELAHLGEFESRDGMATEQRRYVAACEDHDSRSVVYYTESGHAVEVDNVSDSPSRAGVDVRGWDRPTSYSRRAEPSTKPVKAFSAQYRERKSERVFTLTNRGWFYNHQRVSTMVAQRLNQRLAHGRLEWVGNN